MIVLKSLEEIEKLRAANAVVVEVQALLQEQLAPGVTTLDLDRMAEEYIRKAGGKPSFLGYQGYQHTLCVARNHVVVHGIPNKDPLEAGDILGIDCGVYLDGFHGDHARTYTIGTVSQEIQDFLRISEASLMKGIECMQVDGRLYDISSAIQSHAESHGYSIVKDYVGHGVGKQLHEAPQVPNFGKAGTGMKLVPGLVLAIEPMLNMGKPDVRLLDDEWTVVTADGSLSTHFEHSVALTEDGPQILSKV